MILTLHFALPGRQSLKDHREHGSLHSQETYKLRGAKKPTIVAGCIWPTSNGSIHWAKNDT